LVQSLVPTSVEGFRDAERYFSLKAGNGDAFCCSANVTPLAASSTLRSSMSYFLICINANKVYDPPRPILEP
jgi:hypothetical protein